MWTDNYDRYLLTAWKEPKNIFLCFVHPFISHPILCSLFFPSFFPPFCHVSLLHLVPGALVASITCKLCQFSIARDARAVLWKYMLFLESSEMPDPLSAIWPSEASKKYLTIENLSGRHLKLWSPSDCLIFWLSEPIWPKMNLLICLTLWTYLEQLASSESARSDYFRASQIMRHFANVPLRS